MKTNLINILPMGIRKTASLLVAILLLGACQSGILTPDDPVAGTGKLISLKTEEKLLAYKGDDNALAFTCNVRNPRKLSLVVERGARRPCPGRRCRVSGPGARSYPAICRWDTARWR